MEQAARVTRITEYGDARMTRAIAQGLVTGDVKSDVERALREREEARREAHMYKIRNIELEAIRREDARRHITAYGARLREKGLWRDIKGLVAVAVIITAMLSVAAASVILWAVTA